MRAFLALTVLSFLGSLSEGAASDLSPNDCCSTQAPQGSQPVAAPQNEIQTLQKAAILAALEERLAQLQLTCTGSASLPPVSAEAVKDVIRTGVQDAIDTGELAGEDSESFLNDLVNFSFCAQEGETAPPEQILCHSGSTPPAHELASLTKLVFANYLHQSEDRLDTPIAGIQAYQGTTSTSKVPNMCILSGEGYPSVGPTTAKSRLCGSLPKACYQSDFLVGGFKISGEADETKEAYKKLTNNLTASGVPQASLKLAYLKLARPEYGYPACSSIRGLRKGAKIQPSKPFLVREAIPEMLKNSDSLLAIKLGASGGLGAEFKSTFKTTQVHTRLIRKCTYLTQLSLLKNCSEEALPDTHETTTWSQQMDNGINHSTCGKTGSRAQRDKLVNFAGCNRSYVAAKKSYSGPVTRFAILTTLEHELIGDNTQESLSPFRKAIYNGLFDLVTTNKKGIQGIAEKLSAPVKAPVPKKSASPGTKTPPAAGGSRMNTKIHTVVAGDTYWKLARTYGAGTAECVKLIQSLNQGKPLEVGGDVLVPRDRADCP